MIVWLRHGESTWNAAGRFQGHTAHPPLTGRGREQVLSAVPALRALAPTRLVSSTAVRAVQSAELLAAPLGLTAEADARLVEQGLRESLADVVARVESFVTDAGPDATVLVVSHGDTIAVAHHLLTGHDLPGPLANAAFVTTG